MTVMVSADAELKSIKQALDASAIVAITDRAGTIIHVNDKFCEISKYPRAELIGKNHRIVNSKYHTADFFKEMWSKISSGKRWEGEIRNRAKDGSLYWVNTSIVPFLDENDRPYQYVSIRYDITARKSAEEKLKVYAARLEERNKELQDFASVAAHDLQEPLRKVQAFSDRIKVKCGADLSETAIDYLTRIQSSTERMQTLINDLLTFSRVTTRAQPFVRTDLNTVLTDVLSDLEFSLEKVGGKVEASELPSIDADASQMRQLFQNLISNALKFHKPGEKPVVHIGAESKNDRVQLSFRDNGIGFDEKYLDRIFTIFQRLHGRHEYEGTGVGLAICKRIAERHGGSISAISSPGAGATFIVTILMVQPHEGE